jgi:hypothetical protein
MWDKRRLGFVVLSGAFILLLCFLTVHPGFDVYIHQDAASTSSTVVLTSLSSARKASQIISGIAHVESLIASWHFHFPAQICAGHVRQDELSSVGLSPLSRSEVLLI